MRRRIFIHQALLASTAWALPACQRGTARAAVLRALVEQVVVPNTAAVAEDSRRLQSQIARLGAEPTLATLRAAREQWQRALLSWKRADVFRSGPIMDTNVLLRTMFWPVRIAAIEALLHGSDEIDDARIDTMGVDRRGLFALEYLLYSPASDELIVAGFSGPAGERRARLARSLAGNISFHAAGVARLLGDGKKYADELAEGAQDSISRVVGHLVHGVENGAANRLTRVASLAKSGRLKATEVEGSSARMSQQIVLTYLQGAEQLYIGVQRGVSQLVTALSPALDLALRSAFSRSITAVSDLGLPLEEVAQRDVGALDAAVDALRKLERALKTELTSTLGVTLTFSSVDGD